MKKMLELIRLLITRNMKLSKVKTINIKPSKPFNFDATFHKPDHFESSDSFWEPGIRWQAWRWQNIPLGIKFVNMGTVSNPDIQIKIFSENILSKDSINSLESEIIYRFNLQIDLKDFYIEFKNDKLLSPIIKKWKGMRPGHENSLYEYLIIGVVLQNTVVKRSIQMLQNLFENFGIKIEFDNKMFWCFWEPGELHKVTEEQLRNLKLGYRAKTIKRLDDYFYDDKINENKLRNENEEVQKTELLKIYGVGPATVWYLLFDVFHRWDFFEHISPWEQKIYTKLFFNKDPEKPVEVSRLLKYFERYGKYKQLAVHYIWEDIWWKRKNESIPWLEKEIRI